MARPVWTAERTTRALVRRLLPVRSRWAHKGDFGKVLLLCGSKGLAGAAMLAAKAALRTGSGLVYLGVPEAIYPIAAGSCASAVVFPLACDEDGKFSLSSFRELEKRLSGMDAVLFGCGVGQSEELWLLLKWLFLNCRVPLVLDADGINLLAQHMDVLRGSKCPVILTPHDGEFRRLGGDPKANDRVGEAMRFALDTGTILLLKGHRTIITDGQNVYRNTTGNPGMATGGSGDVLSGVIVSLLGQHVMPLEAAAAGAWLHGAAGDLAAREIGEYGMIPEDIVERLPRLLRRTGESLAKKTGSPCADARRNALRLQWAGKHRPGAAGAGVPAGRDAEYMQLCGGNFGGLWRYRLPIYAFVRPHAGKWYTDDHHCARDACGTYGDGVRRRGEAGV